MRCGKWAEGGGLGLSGGLGFFAGAFKPYASKFQGKAVLVESLPLLVKRMNQTRR